MTTHAEPAPEGPTTTATGTAATTATAPAGGEGTGEPGARVDLTWGTIPDLARTRAERFPDDEALVDGDTRLSFAELWTAARRAAAAFVAAGVVPGDRVALWAPNIWEWPVALLGLHAAGAAAVPLNTRYKGTEAAYILGKSRARLLVTLDGFLGTDYVSMLRGRDLPHLERIVVLRPEGGPAGAGGSAAPAGAGGPDVVGWDDFLASGDGVDGATLDRRLESLGADDVSDIMFTSGTTGAPKGVIATHGQNLRAYHDWAALVGLRRGDRYLVISPFFHSFGYKAGIVSALVAGATMVPQAVFDADEAMRKVAEHRITCLPGPPAIYQTILNHPAFVEGELDLSSLRLAVTGAAAIPVSLVERMRDELGFETVLTAYGLTEATGFATACRDDDDPETIATTSGRAIPGVEVRIVDDDGTAQPPGEPGEIVVRGYNVMQGYFEDPEQTAATIDPDGWLHTGDIGTLDERGYIRITDRKKDMFIVGGFNAYPAEIEDLLSTHEGIAQVAVIGVPDERLGEVGMAFVVPRTGHRLDAGEIVAWARENMANYKVPRHVRLVDALPVNASGKVVKYELRQQAAAAVEQ
jgi:acyl-CoA synthetase (AMP-forming)/AMP-acid ligase II